MDARHIRAHSHTGESRSKEQEFERLYRESYASVYGYVRARMSSDQDAEDIVSEAYMRAARSFDSFDPERAKFSTWVTTIARNCAISQFRRARPTTALESAPQEVYAVEGGQHSVESLLLAKRFLACLSDEERELVALKYRDGYRNVEIARELHMNSSTVSTVLSRALSKMRDMAQHDEQQGSF